MTVARPLRIGISPRFQHHFPTDFGVQNKVVQYIEQSVSHWVTDSGALSFMIPSVSGKYAAPAEFIDPNDYARELDALILQGGADVGVDLVRDRFEIELIKAFHTAEKPVLGVCRGMQLLNVYFGGTLIPDIGTKFPNERPHFEKALYDSYTHAVDILPGGYLETIYGNVKDKYVVSIHHQAVDRLGDNLLIEGISKGDGIIEAISHKGDSFILGVQWHPEFHDRHGETALAARPLINALLESARSRKISRKARWFVRDSRKLVFEPSEPLSLGVELEFQLIDPNSYDLKRSSLEILKELSPQTSKVKSEIFQSMIEVETGVCRTANEAETDLMSTISILRNACAKRSVRLAATGTHPFASYRDRKLSPGNRYLDLVERNQWIARRLLIFGLHVHIGMPDANTVVRIMNAFMYHAPLLLGLSSSSPFWHGDETGLASARSTLFESTPTGGHPVMVDSWGEYESLYFRMLDSNSIQSPKDLWWDLRPSPHFGTLEIRCCDIMPTLKENIAMAALMHAMAAHFLENLASGKSNVTPTAWQYRENKWRATRYGLDFDFVANDWGEVRSAKSVLFELLDRITTARIPMGSGHDSVSAGDLYADKFELIRQIIEKGSSASRQRAVFEETGALESVVKHNCNEFESNKLI